MARHRIWPGVTKARYHLADLRWLKGTNLARSLDTETSFFEDFIEERARKGPSRLRWVSQLMQDGRKEWDVNKLKTCLYPHDIEAVLKIRLSQKHTEDYIVWHYEKSSLFTVKSAYWLAVQMEG